MNKLLFCIFLLSHVQQYVLTSNKKMNTDYINRASINFIKENKSLIFFSLLVNIVFHYNGYKIQKNQHEQNNMDKNTQQSSNDQQICKDVSLSRQIQNNQINKPIIHPYNHHNTMVNKQNLPLQKISWTETIYQSNNSNQRAKIIIDLFCDNIYGYNNQHKERTKIFFHETLLGKTIYNTLWHNNLIDCNGIIQNKNIAFFFDTYTRYTSQFITLLSAINEFFSLQSKDEEKKYHLFKYYVACKDSMMKNFLDILKSSTAANQAIRHTFTEISRQYHDIYFAKLQNIIYAPPYQHSNVYEYCLQILSQQKSEIEKIETMKNTLQKAITAAIT